ncbi:MAG TPA: aminotransferase class I/II-fold pyridoxal phosphate-dependent enzyme [Mycobacterium sp.]|nr:aminotransferase class I/II-fold pyridoxal phosphate-dependent enzyme [Mycobacterium sp.]
MTDACVEAGETSPPTNVPLALALNENHFPPLPAVRTAIADAAASVNRYPEFLPNRMRAVIAGHVGIDAASIVVGAGATGVAIDVLRNFTSPGDRIVTASPTFDGYPIFIRLAGLQPALVPLDEHGCHDLGGMADAAAEARVVVLCRPHNPTGTIETRDDVAAWLRRLSPDTLVILDEAYVDFVSPAQRLDARAIVERHPNVVVLRTFSKAYGLAGLRIGYAVCAPAVASRIWDQHLPFQTTSLSLAAVQASIAAESQLAHRIAEITAERVFLQKRLQALGVWSARSHANFVYLGGRGRSWPEVFRAAGLTVRAVGDDAVRVTVGDRTASLAVLDAVRAAGIPGSSW